MVVIILAGLIMGGCLLYCLCKWKRELEKAVDAIAVVAYIGFFSLAARSVIRTLLDHTVFMTQVHEVLMDPVFLACGAYLGPYGLRLLLERLAGR
ncbi:hypothetical protein [Paenibacillus nasutitermitis]|uniref:Uncharacterized protein n=1 Tax=Paenibacillus nasutitermitis TaxID=1652958 RepID=A0A916YK51_9BACL|nr:hypothetical protein [Paenibacillus nasutitermitis]GGD49611.1 hypothetical protein GCM10010911_03910 [Paenibacillus nasutitermitis]